MPGARPVLDGWGGAGAVGGVLLDAVSGAGLPAAGVGGWCYGNAVAERLDGRDQLRRRIRTGKGRCPYPVTLIVDSQSVKGASTVGAASRGYDAGKKINCDS